MTELASLLPKNPGFEKVQAMLNADLTGENYQDGKAKSGGSDEDFVPAKPKASKPAAEDDLPFTPSKPTTTAAPAASASDGDADVDDMLAAIRARRAAGK